MSFKKITESDSYYNNLELKSSIDLLKIINNEDQSVALNVKNEIESINTLINKLVDQLNNGGRLFYIGSGTSGRLGVVDASECPPTFGVKSNLVNGIIAGGDKAIRKSIENAEDDELKGFSNKSIIEIDQSISWNIWCFFISSYFNLLSWSRIKILLSKSRS